MKDQLEDFVRKNRDAFDDQEAPENAWKNIEASLSFQQRKGLWNSLTLWRAAAVIFMAITAYLLVPTTTKKHPSSDLALKEFNDVEAFYVRQISEKVEMIDEFQKNDGLNGYTQDFKQLEAMYMVLKEEMKTRSSQKVKDALVLNLLVRIDLLNKQLHKLEKDGEKEEGKTNV